MNTRFLFLPLLVLLLFQAPGISAQEGDVEEVVPLYGLGDQTFSLHAGIVTPLFFLSLSGETSPGLKNLSVGGTASLEWNSFITSNLSAGIELSGFFTFTELDRGLVLVPIVGKLTYFIRAYPFEFPLHVGLGVNFTKLDEDLYFGPILKPGFSAYWNYDSQWAFGMKFDYWFVPELYFGDSPPQEQSRFGNFLESTLSVFYHF